MLRRFFGATAVICCTFLLGSCTTDDMYEQVSYEQNYKDGIDFLNENAKREGVVTTESGLQYEVLKEGTGEMPTATDMVRCHYRGTLIDGTVFDSSYDGDPVTFKLNGVIKGWTEGLQLMKEGAKYRFYIPYFLAYGDRSISIIQPYSTLIFDVELIEVIKM